MEKTNDDDWSHSDPEDFLQMEGLQGVRLVTVWEQEKLSKEEKIEATKKYLDNVKNFIESLEK